MILSDSLKGYDKQMIVSVSDSLKGYDKQMIVSKDMTNK